MQQLVKRKPSEIAVGDRINHAGAEATVESLDHSDDAWGDTWTMLIRYSYTGGLYIVYYQAREIVNRYESHI